MSYLGVANMRTTAPQSYDLQNFIAVGNAGIKFDVITLSSDIGADLAGFDSVAKYIGAVEGINEVNSYTGDVGATVAFQAALYSAIKSDPALAGVPVTSFSLSVGYSQTGYPNIASYADYGNFHAYTSGGGSPNQSILYELSLQETVPGKPAYLTEDGYYTLPDHASGVSQQFQAIGDVEVLLDAAADGIAKTFLYELYDDGTSQQNGNYGLFDANGNAKPVAYAIHNLTSLLADTGANATTFTAATPDITVSGLAPINGKSEVFAKSDGSFDVAVWSELNLFNEQAGTVYNVSTPVTVNFGGGNYDVKVFDPIAGTAAIQTATGVTGLTLTAGDDPLIIQLTPSGGTAAIVPTTPVAPTPPVITAPAAPPVIIPAAPVITPPAAPTDGTPLALGLSEDAGSSDAQYSISIDGAQVYAATEYASHSLDQNDSVSVPAGIEQGTHVVTVTLLNPSQDPTALYVNSLSLDTVDTLLDTQLNAATPSVSFTVTNPEPSTDGPITSDTVNGGSLPGAFLTTTTPSVNSFGQTYIRNAGAGTAQPELAGQQTADAGAGPDNFIERAGIKAETIIYGFNPSVDTINLVGYSLADPNNSIFQNGTTETIQLKDGNAIDLVMTSGIPKSAFNWGG